MHSANPLSCTVPEKPRGGEVKYINVKCKNGRGKRRREDGLEITASFRTFLGPAMAVRVFQTGVQANSTWTVLFISPSISKLCIIGRVGVLIRHHQIVSIASVKVTADTGQYVLTLVFGIRGYVHAGAFVKSYLYVHQNAHTLTHTAHVKI
mgnify:CR=1 FL=1